MKKLLFVFIFASFLYGDDFFEIKYKNALKQFLDKEYKTSYKNFISASASSNLANKKIVDNSLYFMGFMIYQGYGVKKDMKKGLKLHINYNPTKAIPRGMVYGINHMQNLAKEELKRLNP